MSASLDSLKSFPEEFLMFLTALKKAGMDIQVKVPETPQQEFERLIQTRDAIEY